MRDELTKLIALGRKAIEASAEPDCGCLYYHENCDTMLFREAIAAWEECARSLERQLPLLSFMEQQVSKLSIEQARNTARSIELHRETGCSSLRLYNTSA